MVRIVLIFVLIFSFSCKEERHTSSLKKKMANVIVADSADSLESKGCTEFFYTEDGMPMPKFLDLVQTSFSKTYLSDTLFVGFSQSSITTKSKRNYLEFTHLAMLPTKWRFDFAVNNTFRFYKYHNETYGLAYAELNFPASYYKYVYGDKDVFKVVKDSSLIDIGISKQDFAKLFIAETKAVCDTIKIGDDSSVIVGIS
jgi:hypothetical protein